MSTTTSTSSNIFNSSSKDLRSKTPTSANSRITNSATVTKKPLITPTLIPSSSSSSSTSSSSSSSTSSSLTSALNSFPTTTPNSTQVMASAVSSSNVLTSLNSNNSNNNSSKNSSISNVYQETITTLNLKHSSNQNDQKTLISATTAASSTGTASSILNSLSSVEDKENNKSTLNSNSNKNKIDELELLTTVGTGTFGRVITVRHKQTKEYYALKIMSISEILRLKQTDHVKNEKEILTQTKHPFIINLYWTSHSEKFLYMLFEYVSGGELFSYLRNAVKFSNETANFYATEIVCALEYLHSLSIIYRDLKPENLLLDKNGHIKICDFGFAKKVHDRTWTLCGTPEYLAPEIIVGKGHHKAVDWWALGILIYEMLAGYPPFYDENPFQIYQKILAGKVEWPRNIDLVAKDLIKKLLVNDRTKRLGTMKNGPEDIKRHKWFRHIDWESVPQRKLQPPIVPKINHDGDTRNFDKYDEDGWKDVPTVSSKNFQPFEDF